MCHAFLCDSKFYAFLFEIDRDIAAAVRVGGCPCGGKLHSARYPRKPRGVARALLGEAYERRLSYCCAVDGCRRRCTPPSVRFLGRKVYLGVMVVLLTACEHGLSASRRRRLIEAFEVAPQTLSRWRQWWRQRFADSACWRTQRGHFLPPVSAARLPGALLGRLRGAELQARVCRLLVLVAPVTTSSWSGYLPVRRDPQTM